MTKEDQIRQREQEWKEGTIKKALKRFPLLRGFTSRFYTPLDIDRNFDFLGKGGFSPVNTPSPRGFNNVDVCTNRHRISTGAEAFPSS